MPDSMLDRIANALAGKKQARKELSEQKKRELMEEIKKSKFSTAKKREEYKLRAQDAIDRARNAAMAKDNANKRLAMNELKMYYGFYHYMCSLYIAFCTIESQMQMQAATEEFAEVATRLAGIKPKNSGKVNFADLTRKALKGFKPVDMTGLDKMVDDLVRGSITATESDSADDAFLEALISGQSSLDTPFPSETLQEHDANKSVAEESHEDIMTLLDKVAEGLKD